VTNKSIGTSPATQSCFLFLVGVLLLKIRKYFRRYVSPRILVNKEEKYRFNDSVVIEIHNLLNTSRKLLIDIFKLN
jgi:hypothetical protein